MTARMLAAGPDWGTVPDWLAAVGTLAAFAVALGLFRKEQKARREYEEDRRREQARLVNVWLAYKEYSKRSGVVGRVVVRNRSEEPVYDVTATTVTAGSPWASDPERLWLPDEEPPDESPKVVLPKLHTQTIQWTMLSPGQTLEWVSDAPDFSHRDLVVGLSFTDSQGRRWKRLPDGTLTEATKPPRRSRKDYMNAWIARELDDLDY